MLVNLVLLMGLDQPQSLGPSVLGYAPSEGTAQQAAVISNRTGEGNPSPSGGSKLDADGSEPPAELRVVFPAEAVSRERYVALAAPGLDWQKPVAEAVFPPGQEAVLAVPAGSYRVFCSALGYEPAYGKQVRAEAGKRASFSCEPQPLVAVCGKLLAEDTGQPIAGGTVEVATVGVRPPLLSPLGLAHLQRTFRASSDREGKFCMLGKPTFAAPLRAWAPGFAVTVVPKVVFDKQGQPLPPVVLSREAVVELRLSGVEELFGGLPIWVFLREKGTKDRVVLRELVQELPTELHHVPAGAFEVLLGKDPSPEGAKVLGHVAVDAGESVTVQLSWALARLDGKVQGELGPGSCQVEFLRMREKANTAVAPLQPAGEGEARFSVVLEQPGRHLAMARCKSGEREWARAVGEVEVKTGRSSQKLAFTVEKGSFSLLLGERCASGGCRVYAVTPELVPSKDSGFCTGPVEADGRFTCPVPMGQAVVVAQGPGGTWAGPQLVADGAALAWEAGREVQVAVVDQRGEPVERAWVNAFPLADADMLVAWGRTDEQGLVRLSLPRRDVLLIVVSQGPELGSSAAVCPASRSRCEFVLPPAATLVVRGDVPGWPGIPLVELEGLLLPAHTHAFPVASLGQGMLVRRLPSGSRVRLVELTKEGKRNPLTRPLVLAPGERRTVTLAPRGH